MSSSRPSLATVRADLDGLLGPNLPADWERVTNLEKLPASFRRPILATEFTRITVESPSGVMPRGRVWCEFDLLIAVPTTDDEKGEADADKAVFDLIVVLDRTDGPVTWVEAKKERLESGQLYWRVSLAVLTTTIEGA